MASDHPTPETIQGQSRENQLRFILSVGSRRWQLILGISLAAMLGNGLFTMLTIQPRVSYEASTTLIVRQSPWERDVLKGVGGVPLYQNSPKALVDRVGMRGLADDVVHTLVQQAITEGRSLAMLASEEEYAARSGLVERALSLQPSDSGIITIRGKGQSDEEVRALVDIAARAFVDRNRQFIVEEEQQTHEFVLKQLEEIRQRLDEAESAEWQFRKAMGYRTHEQLSKKMEEMYEELVEGATRKEELQARVKEIEGQLAEKNQQLPESLGQMTDTVISGLLDDLNKLLEQQLTMSIQYQPDYQPLLDLKEDIEDKKATILAAVRKLDESNTAGVNTWQDRQELRRKHVELQLEFTSLEVRTATIERLINDMVKELPELGKKKYEHERLVHEAERARTQFNSLLEKEFEIRTSIRRGSGQVERHTAVVASPLPVPTGKTGMSFLLGGLVGLLAGFGLAIMLEMLDTSIRSMEDIPEHLGLEVLGTIPLMKFTKGQRRRGNYVSMTNESQIDASIVTQHDPKSPVSEAYRVLRTNFQFATILTKPKSVMITSAVPGEGKTTTAVNMAVTLADIGMKVLLIDTDLRRPHVHHVLRIDRGLGLSDLLRDNLDFHSVVRPTQVANLYAISSGRVPPNPSELIGSDRMKNLLRAMEHEFDIILCDAPSILVVTDPVLLARDIGTVLLVVSANNARRETILRARKLMDAAHVSISGAVLNGLEATRRHYYYYYYYYDEASSRSHRRWYHL